MTKKKDLVWLHDRQVTREYYEAVKAAAAGLGPVTPELRDRLAAIVGPSLRGTGEPRGYEHEDGSPVDENADNA